jgi:lipid-binding SYLF domain-containing protein
VKHPAAILVVVLLATPAFADDAKEVERLQNATTVLKEILGMPESIPKDLLDRAECMIVFPSVKKVAVGVGGTVSMVNGARRRCSRSRAGASAFNSVDRRPISCCW